MIKNFTITLKNFFVKVLCMHPKKNPKIRSLTTQNLPVDIFY
ncbi:hypothetical protein BCLUESOX_662 [bacterium endosymbiont of Bathymodiolus sp. 5 South]|nr:hypothetical protein [uncultured Gammaproteobacteria bacterium]SHN92629.1 hypothetical protein BCLUESOX_2655 [bacterium endosymbiont of Bathymodiolus sp. 5 South]SHN93478.1 hypothetical protein BCLUESOX_662 [bacterium endosymbiont of Bathymodiolus sp. 5 South]VVH59220.1 hypothetical protein BSPCLSOX_2822 [uncultured Gammaproteobacteria bacterium]